MRPGFSVTIAVIVPGRKAIAQGESKVATSETVNGGFADGASALVECDVPQLASRRKKAACIASRVIRDCSVSPLEPLLTFRPLTKGHDATLQLTLNRHRG